MRDNTRTKSANQSMDHLYAEHSGAIRTYLRSRCRCCYLVDDITSEVFISATRLLCDRPREIITRAWLMTVAKRRLVDHWRGEGRRHKLGQALKAAESVRPPPRGELCVDTDVDLLLSPVPERQRAALSLRYVGGLSVGEVADRMELTYQGTESLLARGRRSLATSLSGARS